MPSGTCSRRAGFADTIRLVASLIVLGCSIAARTAENAFGKRGNRFANAISLRRALNHKTRAARRCYGMALVGPGIPWRDVGGADLIVAMARPFCVAAARAVAVQITMAAPTLATARRSLRRRLSVSDRSDAL